MSECKDDVNKPRTDDTQIECCGIYPSNCVVTSESDPYLKIGKGETLTNVIKTISLNIKKLFQKVNYLDRYYEMTGGILQESSGNPTLLGPHSNILSGYTFTRVTIGVYDLVFTQPVLIPGSVVFIPNNDLTTKIVKYTIVSTTTIRIETFNVNTSAPSDDFLNNDSLLIKIPK